MALSEGRLSARTVREEVISCRVQETAARLAVAKTAERFHPFTRRVCPSTRTATHAFTESRPRCRNLFVRPGGATGGQVGSRNTADAFASRWWRCRLAFLPGLPLRMPRVKVKREGCVILGTRVILSETRRASAALPTDLAASSGMCFVQQLLECRIRATQQLLRLPSLPPFLFPRPPVVADAGARFGRCLARWREDRVRLSTCRTLVTVQRHTATLPQELRVCIRSATSTRTPVYSFNPDFRRPGRKSFPECVHTQSWFADQPVRLVTAR